MFERPGEFKKVFGENPRNLTDPDIYDIQKAIKENRKALE